MLRTLQNFLTVSVIVVLCVTGLSAEEGAKPVNVNGTVVSVADDHSSVTIAVKENKNKNIEAGEVTLTLTEKTKYAGDIASAADLVEGLAVKAKAKDGVATIITVGAAPEKKKTEDEGENENM